MSLKNELMKVPVILGDQRKNLVILTQYLHQYIPNQEHRNNSKYILITNPHYFEKYGMGGFEGRTYS